MEHPKHSLIMKSKAACMQNPSSADLVIDFTEAGEDWRLIVPAARTDQHYYELLLAAINYALDVRAANAQASNRYFNDQERRAVAGVMRGLSESYAYKADFLSKQQASLLAECSWTCLGSNSLPDALKRRGKGASNDPH